MDINPFRSFWMAGYECSDKLNAFGNRVDFLRLTGHLERINEDYRDLGIFNIQTVREGVRWSQVEKTPYQYDWSVLERMIDSGRKNAIQQVWDLCHFGFPDDLTPLHPMFARRFAAFCKAFIEFYRSKIPYGTLVVTPINEVSFLSWLGGDARGTSPYCIHMGWEVKYALMRAYIEGVAVLKAIDPTIRILATEPLVNMVPPVNATEQQIKEAALQHEYQYQVFDILSGRICQQLGGRPEFLDIIGCNFYYHNQWIYGTGEFLPWANEFFDRRWRSLSNLLEECYQRYNRPVVLAETSHSGEHRPNWIEYISQEAVALLEQNIPFWGVCIYPVIDRPDWDDLSCWHHSGVWDSDTTRKQSNRVLNEPYARALLSAQALVSSVRSGENHLLLQY